ncbi:hypothetical protein MMC24_007914 [Lignoscripta atroalba]|nr:hypothetical protein [Lignoscripta atroalba]
MAGNVTFYVNSLFAPQLIAEFGWQRSDFALIGLTALAPAIFLPLVGRAVDRLGTRVMATAGVVLLPLIFLALSMIGGDFRLFFLLSVLQVLVISCLMGAIVYTRLIAQRFNRARGVALGIAACSAPLAAIAMGPILGAIIAAGGWRVGYLSLAALAAVVGSAALFLMPRGSDAPAAEPSVVAHAPGGYAFLRQPEVWIIVAAIFLANLHYTIQINQIQVVLLDRGFSVSYGAFMVSVASIGMLTGRILCGLALDRFPSHLVSAVCLGLPGIGLAILGSGLADPYAVAFAVLTIGFSIGAEGDIMVFFAAKYFKRSVFSTVLGGFSSAFAISAALGSVLAGQLLRSTGGYDRFFQIATVSVLTGAVLMIFLAKAKVPSDVLSSAVA